MVSNSRNYIQIDYNIGKIDWPSKLSFIWHTASNYNVQIVVASDKEDKVAPLREAFQNVFGQATVVGLASRYWARQNSRIRIL